MKLKRTLLHVAVATATFALISLASCGGKEPKVDPKKPGKEIPTPEKAIEGKIEFLDVATYDAWVFYNLRENKVYKTVKYQENDKGEAKLAEDLSKDNAWDIAFHRWDVKTRAGVFKSEEQDLAKAKDVKLGDFTLDTEGQITYQFGMGGGSGHTVKKTTETYNQLISGGIKKSGSWLELVGMPPQYNLAPNIWFVKTADGKNVALKFTDYRKREGKAGAISLSFVILP